MSFSNRAKRQIRSLLPKSVLERIQSFRKSYARPDPLKASYRKQFELLNPTSSHDAIVMRPGMEFRIDPGSHEAFQWFCWRSPSMVEEFDLFLNVRTHCRSFLDIGANHGVYSLAFTHGRPESTAVAIDPSPLAFPILQRNAELNGNQIRCIQVAAGDSVGQVRMKLNWHNLEIIADQGAKEDDQVKIVPVRPMDDVCKEIGFAPDLVKIDVEGFELKCLMGLDQTLRTHRPPFVLEVHPDLIRAIGYTERELTSFVTGIGYEFFHMDGRKLSNSYVHDQIHTSWYLYRPRAV